VLAIAHPWASAPSYLSLRSASPILAATFMPPRGRPTLVVHSFSASLSCRFVFCRVALLCLVMRRRRRLPIPCLAVSRSLRPTSYKRGNFSLQNAGISVAEVHESDTTEKRLRSQSSATLKAATEMPTGAASSSYGPETNVVDIVIIGAGLSGLVAAAYLKKEGIDSFIVVDEGAHGAVGGTWRDHNFPNAGTATPRCQSGRTLVPPPAHLKPSLLLGGGV